ncbi:MAG: catalase [Mogibacterium sp.]|nr:catalase [Mogibacterium sp.]MBQ6501389.1 catalase [Mogibacterium sp.]
MHPIQHFKTVHEHRKLVRGYCFKLGLYRQGLMHDLSKYSPVEFWRGARYYQGNRSPNNREREIYGRSIAWLHHKGRNKHHFEYWIDYILNEDGSVGFGGNRMPKEYIAEMFCDRVSASRTYLGKEYTDASPYEYYVKGTGTRVGQVIHPETAAELEKMLKVLKDEGEEAAISYIRKWLGKKP